MEVRNNVARRYSAIISQVGDGAAEEVARDPAEEVGDGPLKKWEMGR